MLGSFFGFVCLFDTFFLCRDGAALPLLEFVHQRFCSRIHRSLDLLVPGINKTRLPNNIFFSILPLSFRLDGLFYLVASIVHGRERVNVSDFAFPFILHRFKLRGFVLPNGLSFGKRLPAT